MIKKFFYYFNLLLKCHYIFKKPRKIDILLYDQGSLFNKRFRKSFEEFDVDVLYTRLEEINLYVLIRSLLKINSLNKNFLFLNYLKTYCVLYEPKWIITSNHLDIKFYKLKKIVNSKTKFGIIQRSPIFKFQIDNFFKHILIENDKLIIDYYFCFDEISKKILQDYLKTNFVIIGSFSNNYFPLKRTEKKNDILVVSGFREGFIKLVDKGSEITNLEHEKNLVKLLSKVCFNQKLTFKILLKPLTKIEDYTKFNEINNKYCIYNDGTNAYEEIDNFRLIIFPNDSALRFEAISRKKNICIMQPHYQLDKEKISSPCVLKGDLNYKNILELVKANLIIDFKSFSKMNEKLTSFFSYDENNSILKLIINKEINN